MNPLTFPLLRFLGDGCFQSLTKTSAALGVTEAETADALEELGALGIDVERGSGESYRLTKSIRWLDQRKIASHIGKDANQYRIEIVEQTGSTNSDLMALARQGADSGLVRAAELQTAGRGSRQRVWHTGIGDALTFSLLWTFSSTQASLSALSLAVGVSIVRSLRALGVADAALKWPNDIVWKHRKVGGVLIETTSGVSDVVKVVIGIGLNLGLSQSIARRIDQPASGLYEAGFGVDRNRLLGQLLIDLRVVLDVFSRRGFAALKSEWERLHAYQAKIVTLSQADGTAQEGSVVGVDDDGALLLAVGRTTRRFNVGQLSLRQSRAKGD